MSSKGNADTAASPQIKYKYKQKVSEVLSSYLARLVKHLILSVHSNVIYITHIIVTKNNTNTAGD